jgi:hypothetical protein
VSSAPEVVSGTDPCSVPKLFWPRRAIPRSSPCSRSDEKIGKEGQADNQDYEQNVEMDKFKKGNEMYW